MPVVIRPAASGGDVTIVDNEGGGIWGEITGTLSAQTDLQAELDGKAEASHSHTIGNVTGLQTALDGKASISHTHAISDVTGLQAALDASGNTWTLVDQSGDPIEVEEASWTWSTNVTEVAFTGLDDASEVLIYAHGVSVSVSGAAMVQVSTNGGSSYYTTSGDYLAIAQTGTAANTIGSTFWSTNSTLARYGTVTILNPTVVGPKFMPSFPSDSTPLRIFVADLSSPINAVRVVGSGGGNITAGKLYVYKKG